MMIAHSLWRVRVAISLVFFFTVHVVVGQSVSKDPFQKKVTIRGQGLAFESVLNQLSEQTKLYFIYSSSSIELNKSISLNADQRPLYEVLEELAQSMSLTFRREGNYVVVKASAEIRDDNEPEKPALRKHRPAEIKAPVLAVVSDEAQPKEYSVIENRLFIPDYLLKKNLLFCPPEFKGIDASYVQNNFPLKITTPRPGRQLFASVGLILNDYSGGLEVRLGIPSLYAVANAGVMRDGYFRYGYGIGSSMPIKKRVSLNPIYTFASLNKTLDYVLDENVNLVVTDGLKFKGKHHQLKFLFQVQLSSRITLHGGPAINFLKASYVHDQTPIVFTEVITSHRPATGYYYSPGSELRIYRSVQYLPPPDYFTLKSWVGFEGGISYSIKFPRR